MSPYIVPDHVLERNLSTSLTPTFWGALTIVSFDSLDSDSPQLESNGVVHGNPLSAQLSTSSKEPENASTPLSKSTELPVVQHRRLYRRLYFDDGSITFRVRLLHHLDTWYPLNWRNLHRSRTICIASIGLCSVADRRNSRISFRSFPPSKSPRPLLPFL